MKTKTKVKQTKAKQKKVRSKKMAKTKKKTKNGKKRVPEGLKGYKFTTKPFRVSFPTLAEPKAFEDKGDKKYSIEMIVPKDSEANELFQKAIRKAKIEAFGKDKENWPKMKTSRRDGDEMEDVPEGFEGQYVYRAHTTKKPMVLDRDKTKMSIDDIKEKIYGGSYGDAVLICKVVQGPSQIYVVFYLQAYRFIADGESFGSGASVEDFEDLEDSEDEDSEDEDSEDEESDDED